ncbi:MAG: cysteine hydrolase family protein [Anaerovoracaceae bacterium]
MNEALLVIDMQQGFINPASPFFVKGALDTVPYCRKAITTARQHQIPVVWVKRIYRSDGTDVEKIRKDVWEEGGKPLTPGSDQRISDDFPPLLQPQKGERVLVKPRFSAFFATPLDLYLRRMDIENLVLIGTMTPNCIRATCFDGLSLDYSVTILENCCSSQTETIQKSNIEDMRRIGAKILSLDTWVKSKAENRE